VRSVYTSLSLAPARTMSGFMIPLQHPSDRSAAHSSAVPKRSPQPQHRSEYRSFRRDPQRPYGLTRPHHFFPEPSRLCGLIRVGHHCLRASFRIRARSAPGRVVELLFISRALGVDPVDLFGEIARVAALSRATAPPRVGLNVSSPAEYRLALIDPPGVAALPLNCRSLTS